MSKQAYFAGAYPVGSAKYKIYKKKFGPIPASAPVAEVKKVVAKVVEQPQEEEKPKVVKKAKKKTYKKRSED